MSLIRVLTGIFKSSEETSEKAKSAELRTRYYKERFDKVFDTVVRIAGQLPKWKVVHVDRERGEIVMEKKHLLWKSDIVVTVYKISPTQSAVDILSAKRGSLGDFGTSYFNILEFFNRLHKEIRPEGH